MSIQGYVKKHRSRKNQPKKEVELMHVKKMKKMKKMKNGNMKEKVRTEKVKRKFVSAHL